MLTRARFEATAKTHDGVVDELVGALELVRETFGGEWELAEPQEVQTTKDGYWGRATMKMKRSENG